MSKERLARLVELAEARGYWSRTPLEQPEAEAAEYERMWAEFAAWMPIAPGMKRGRAK